MFLITGDIHGEIERIIRIGLEHSLGEDDKLLIAGDFGCLFFNDERDEKKLDALAALPFMILFIDGNHECFPKIYSYPEQEWNGARVHVIRHNILHLMRGQVYTIDGQRILTMGGGYSIDKALRIPGRSWWPEELPSLDEYKEAVHNLARHGNRVDLIISHAAPLDTMRMFVECGTIRSCNTPELTLSRFLEEIRSQVPHRHYYFGHMHMDEELWRNQTALYYQVYDLMTDKKV